MGPTSKQNFRETGSDLARFCKVLAPGWGSVGFCAARNGHPRPPHSRFSVGVHGGQPPPLGCLTLPSFPHPAANSPGQPIVPYQARECSTVVFPPITTKRGQSGEGQAPFKLWVVTWGGGVMLVHCGAGAQGWICAPPHQIKNLIFENWVGSGVTAPNNPKCDRLWC